MKKTNANQRQAAILELLSKNGAMKTTDLAEHFQVSRETMRLDLLELTNQGLVKKWFGGVICTPPETPDSPGITETTVIDERMTRMPEEKTRICRKALELIPEHATIFLDCGSTNLYLAQQLRSLSGYTIISTSLQIINTLCGSDNKLIICGGVIDTSILSVCGTPALDFLRQLRTDAAIFGSSGFKANSGPTGLASDYSSIKKIIGVVSGKGGVGKSLVTSMLACSMKNRGHKVGILDADITGPSIPKMFGITAKAGGNQYGMLPVESSNGIDVMSVNLLVDNDTDPVVWRGPVIAGVVQQFYSEVIWEDEDYLFVDMPPGTGDVPLTVFQSLPVDGIVIVTSPQELVSMIVGKAVKMAQKMDIPILGLVENMSYLECPDCGKKISVFGESHIDEVAEEYGIPVLGRIPIQPEIAAKVDAGQVEYVEGNWLDEAAAKIQK